LIRDGERDQHRAPFVEPDRERVEAEQSSELFDRVAFAMLALDRMPPRIATIAVHASRSGAVVIDEGRNWAVLSIPPRASRRAIAHAIATIAKNPLAHWALASLEALTVPYR
jgi:hypothetical protein